MELDYTPDGFKCNWPSCGKVINIGSYCNDDCARYHKAELNNALIRSKDSVNYKMNEIAKENLKKWT